MKVELTEAGYLHLSKETAERFPVGTAIVLVRDDELWLMPVSHSGGGGLLLKMRNSKGDRSILIQEFLSDRVKPGVRKATWDEEQGALRIPLFSLWEEKQALSLRPQPLGVFPGMAGFFLLPWVPDGEGKIKKLLFGRLPDEWPRDWQFFEAAISGKNVEEVTALLPEGVEGAFNRFILTGTREAYQEAKALAEGEISLLLEAAACRMGLAAEPPSAADTKGEVKAFLLATQAYASFQEKDWPGGLSLLREASESVKDVSPVFAARLLAEWAATQQALGHSGAEVMDGYRAALDLLKGSTFREVEGELWFQLGTVHQEAGRHREAAGCYHEALKRYIKEKQPEAYALTHMNLALSYLALPEKRGRGDLRTAVAIQSLREALKIFNKESHPYHWASATMNLANALQHASSSHPEMNLWEAVALYEEVLTVRRKEEDPVAYARVLANQGNALAHLGAFFRAVPRLREACQIFKEYGEMEAAQAVEAVLEEISQRKRAAQQRSTRGEAETEGVAWDEG